MTATSAHGTPSGALADVLCIGETMVMLGADEGSLSESPSARLYVAGAESNVAVGLAHLGQSVEWFGRLGDDPFGERIRTALESRGVETDNVIIDPESNTGVYFKDWAAGRSSIYYYRAGSAAASLSPTDLEPLQLAQRRLCHVSGITPALSSSCNDTMAELLSGVSRRDVVVSFDVNHRTLLWSTEAASPRILELARAADLVVVGRDEAESLWGTPTAESIRELLAAVPIVVVKDADVGATSFVGAERTFVPALTVDVVEPIGAGDAFAAGFLSAWLDGDDAVKCLRLGHLMAAHVLGSVGDTPQLPPSSDLKELTTLSDQAWAELRLPVAESGGTL